MPQFLSKTFTSDTYIEHEGKEYLVDFSMQVEAINIYGECAEIEDTDINAISITDDEGDILEGKEVQEFLKNRPDFFAQLEAKALEQSFSYDYEGK